MSRQKPRQRGGRVPDKATPEQVMGLARNLPLTHSVPGKALEDATPGQLGFLANLLAAENASVFLQIGVHSMGTIFQQHRRLVSSRNCVVGSAAFFLVIWS